MHGQMLSEPCVHAAGSCHLQVGYVCLHQLCSQLEQQRAGLALPAPGSGQGQAFQGRQAGVRQRPCGSLCARVCAPGRAPQALQQPQSPGGDARLPGLLSSVVLQLTCQASV